jgi:hypothetical protein
MKKAKGLNIGGFLPYLARIHLGWFCTEKQFIITRKIAKQGNKLLISIPSILHDELKHVALVKVTIDVLKEAEQ